MFTKQKATDVTIANINDRPELARLHEMEDRLRKQKTELLGILQGASHNAGFGERHLKFDSTCDAEQLIAGGDITLLTAPQEESTYAGWLRQLRAVEAAIPRVEQLRQETYFRLCQEEIERLQPMLREVYDQVLDAFDLLNQQLQRWHGLHGELGRHGIYADLLAAWNLTPIESRLLHGGHQVEALGTYIPRRREVTGLAKEGK